MLHSKLKYQFDGLHLSSLPEQSIVSVKEALFIGERYSMKEEDTKQALRYFHDVSLMLYYPEVTNVIFIDSKPILEILSQSHMSMIKMPKH